MVFCVSLLVLTGAFALASEVKPTESWQPLDLLGEVSLALLAASWCVVVLDSRPGGRVTSLLGGGLAALALAAWADALDEIFRLTAAMVWLGSLESALMPAGILALGSGLVLWRQEQFVLGEQLGARERGWRDHRHVDRLTRLADAAYLRDQMAAEARLPGPCIVAMFEIRSLLEIQRGSGDRAAARLLQLAAQQLLLNLRPEDLVCRYAGDRLVVLMPQTAADEGQRRTDHLRRMVASMRVFVAGRNDPLPIDVGSTCALVDRNVQATLSALGRALDPAESTVRVA